MQDWRNYALSIMATALVTGAVAYFALGAEGATRGELAELRREVRVEIQEASEAVLRDTRNELNKLREAYRDQVSLNETQYEFNTRVLARIENATGNYDAKFEDLRRGIDANRRQVDRIADQIIQVIREQGSLEQAPPSYEASPRPPG